MDQLSAVRLDVRQGNTSYYYPHLTLYLIQKKPGWLGHLPCTTPVVDVPDNMLPDADISLLPPRGEERHKPPSGPQRRRYTRI